jgi:hypothetical protein
MLGYLYGKRFGSKIAWDNRKEGGSPSFLLAQAQGAGDFCSRDNMKQMVQ